ncbi:MULTISPECIES: Hpt domain-containing protein [Edaphosphingomonas]|uniref:Hpt domain-containing protein n=2 Tax=Edaphosphingomonas TaxID=3423724 RepID=A0A2T4HMU5_9SPHN|nr:MULTISPECIES: Hpt domain-containing protein [Sphingomonas]OHT19865.1 hypothetical protein BHE75_01857 [Sphingomonas haloaromaticamans]PTD17124.1 Hpt domain-containing protein [Sphingomonas fennica]
MKYDPRALEATLSAAVGDDAMLAAELRQAFLSGARGHADAMGRTADVAEWRASAMRLQGLAASFGAFELMDLAEKAAQDTPGNTVLSRAIDAVIGGLAS